MTLFQGNKFLDTSEIMITDETSGNSAQDFSHKISLVWATRVNPPIPWFVRIGSGQYSTPQESIFGYYSLRNIIRGILMGISFIPGADILLHKYFLSPSITNYYTAIFHLVFAYLSLEGRVVISPVYGRPHVYINGESSSGTHDELENSPSAICGVLTRTGKWVFEGRRRTHRAFWTELSQLFLENRLAPDCFTRFAEYLTTYGPYKDDYSDEIEMIRDSINLIQHGRHEAIYQGYGFDPWSHDQLTNRDADYAPISLRAKKYQEFTYGLLSHILGEANDIMEKLNKTCSDAVSDAQLELAVAVLTPPFERRRDITDLLDESRYNKDHLSSLIKEFFKPDPPTEGL